ncbi:MULTISPECIES: hypothetical protein [unclassified Streptomyces]
MFELAVITVIAALYPTHFEQIGQRIDIQSIAGVFTNGRQR